jgi:hypothetical protein
MRASTLRFGVYSKTPPPFHAVSVLRAQQDRDPIAERERAFAAHRRIRRIVPCELGADRGARGASIPVLQSRLLERMLRAFSFRRRSIIAAVRRHATNSKHARLGLHRRAELCSTPVAHDSLLFSHRTFRARTRRRLRASPSYCVLPELSKALFLTADPNG